MNDSIALGFFCNFSLTYSIEHIAEKNPVLVWSENIQITTQGNVIKQYARCFCYVYLCFAR